MAQTYEIRGNSKMTQVDTDRISADQLARYLEAEVLGFPIKVDFITTHGPNNGCYVVMNVTIADLSHHQETTLRSSLQRTLQQSSSRQMLLRQSNHSCSQLIGHVYWQTELQWISLQQSVSWDQHSHTSVSLQNSESQRHIMNMQSHSILKSFLDITTQIRQPVKSKVSSQLQQ